MDPAQIEFARQKMAYLVSQGVDPQRAAAMIGNAWHESAGLKPTIWGDNGDSFGLYQFNKRGELPAYQAWAKENGRDLSDWKAQTDFVLNRMKSPQYAQTWDAMGKAPDVAGATKAFMSGYERPAKGAEYLERRVDLANRAAGLNGDTPPTNQIASAGGGLFGRVFEKPDFNAPASPIPFQAPTNGVAMPANLPQPPAAGLPQTAGLGPAFAAPQNQAAVAGIDKANAASGANPFNFGTLGLSLLAAGAPKYPTPQQAAPINRGNANVNLAGLLNAAPQEMDYRKFLQGLLA